MITLLVVWVALIVIFVVAWARFWRLVEGS